MKKLLASVAAIAAMGFAGSAIAASAPMTVTVTVGEILEVAVNNNLDFGTVNNAGGLDVAGLTSPRGKFTVKSNVAFDVRLTAATWFAPSVSATYPQVKFSSGTDYIGGSLFLDDAPAGPPTPGARRWFNGPCAGQPCAGIDDAVAGIKEYFVGGEVKPGVFGNASGEQVNMIAPPGIYTSTATNTVSAATP